MLLVVYFKTEKLRALALESVKVVYGEDGWTTGTVVGPDRSVFDYIEGRGFAADINCVAVDDAVACWAEFFTAIAKEYGIALSPSDIVPEYREDA